MNAAVIPCLQAAGAMPTAAQLGPRGPSQTTFTLQALEETPAEGYDGGRDPDLWLYRDRTVGLLKRYFRISIEVGRLPSLLGREFFRTRVTSYTVSTFEDAVIFVHDVEQSLEQLDPFEQELIAKIVLQAYSHDETARILGCGRRTVGRRFPEALDRLSEIFLKGGLLVRLPEINSGQEKSCQEGKSGEFSASCSVQAK